jgi:hypothetical protein
MAAMSYESLRLFIAPLGIAALWGFAYLVSVLIKKYTKESALKRFLFKER